MAYKSPTLSIYNGAKSDFFASGLMADKSFRVSPKGNRKWFSWLSANKSFRVESLPCNFTARKEMRHNGTIPYWYGYKRIGGKLHKAYVGKEAITPIELYDVANHFLGIKQGGKNETR